MLADRGDGSSALGWPSVTNKFKLKSVIVNIR